MLTSGTNVSRVPYIGFKGDYTKLDAVDFIGLGADENSSALSVQHELEELEPEPEPEHDHDAL